MVNFQKELEKIIEENQKNAVVPSLLLHACCAPCSSYCLEYLSRYFKITVLFYNPNIFPAEEYAHRLDELARLIKELPAKHEISLLTQEFDPAEFYGAVKGLEQEKEGGKRCFVCYRLRLERTAILAKEKGFDYFTTTLSISPLKNAAKLGEIADELAQLYGVKNLPSDFKKKNGYKRSVELSAQYSLYRQNYCGCVFSQRDK